MRGAYFWFVEGLKTIDLHVRFIFNRRTPRRFSIWFGLAKLKLLLLVSPKRRKPIRLAGYTIAYSSLRILYDLYREIFFERLYAFESATPNPKIIDAGANIGLALLYFKYLYPGAEVECFEPDPDSFALLQANIEQNGLGKVKTHNVAVSGKDGTITLYYDRSLQGGDAVQSISREFWEHWEQPDLGSRKVPAKRLSPYLKRPVDILKMDIEGSEGPVLAECATVMKNVSLLQLEYHYDRTSTPLGPILDTFEKAGHDYVIAPRHRQLTSQPGSVAMIYTTKRGKHRVTHAARL